MPANINRSVSPPPRAPLEPQQQDLAPLLREAGFPLSKDVSLLLNPGPELDQITTLAKNVQRYGLESTLDGVIVQGLMPEAFDGAVRLMAKGLIPLHDAQDPGNGWLQKLARHGQDGPELVPGTTTLHERWTRLAQAGIALAGPDLDYDPHLLALQEGNRDSLDALLQVNTLQHDGRTQVFRMALALTHDEFAAALDGARARPPEETVLACAKEFVIHGQDAQAFPAAAICLRGLAPQEHSIDSPLHLLVTQGRETAPESASKHNTISLVERLRLLTADQPQAMEGPIAQTPHGLAAAHTNFEALQALLALDLRDSRGRPALIRAIGEGEHALAEMFVNHGADIHASFSVFTPLALSILHKQEDLAIKLLRQGANPNSPASSRHRNPLTIPLHLACGSGMERLALMLIRRGADINQAASRGATPLHRALYGKHESLALSLLAREASPGGVDDDFDETQNTLGRGRNALHYAAEQGLPEALKALIKKGLALESATRDGESPLLLACRAGHIDCMMALLDAGADIEHVDHDNAHTPLLEAARAGHEDLAIELIRRGANVHHIGRGQLDTIPIYPDSFPVSALAYAREQNLEKLADCLIEHGVDPNDPTHQHLNRAKITSANLYQLDVDGDFFEDAHWHEDLH